MHCIFETENLEASNVFSILPHAQEFEDKDLEDRCGEVIKMHTEEAVTSDEFVTLERSVVESVVKKEALNITEVELFKTFVCWAKRESESQGREKKNSWRGDGESNPISFDVTERVHFFCL